MIQFMKGSIIKCNELMPSQTGNVSISFNVPGTKYTSKKGGSLSFDLSYIGKRKGRDWLNVL